MAYDGIITYGITKELQERLLQGKIEKVYQPGSDELVLQIHTKNGNVKLYASCSGQSPRVCLTEGKFLNPTSPPSFCMLLRKHLQTGRITDIHQVGSDRIIEMDIEAQTELGFDVSKRLIFEIMGKHSNIVLVALDTGKIIDSIKRISIDVNRYRQLLPGLPYQYPPAQDKEPFRDLSPDFVQELTENPESASNPKYLMSHIQGISPAISRELAASGNPVARIRQIIQQVETDTVTPTVYLDENGKPVEFHLTELSEYSGGKKVTFGRVSEAVEFFYAHRAESNAVQQKTLPLHRTVQSAIDKARLKKKRLGEDLLQAENSEKYRLYGELLTANLHLVQLGAKEVTVISYYDNQPVTIPLSEKMNAAKNAQHYFKKYSKAKTAIHEKTEQLEKTTEDITYLESVLQSVEAAKSVEELTQIREELEETGYVRRRAQKGFRRKKQKPRPIEYKLPDGDIVYVGRNNKENDYLTTKLAGKRDLWFHTKDIPGSHVLLPLAPNVSVDDIPAEKIYAVASIAAYHSKAKDSQNVPVDFVPIRYVKKPNGAKPGMVIFTHNTTVYVDPKVPEGH
jgi:predicted ribosome quality control (RQC) complex YloA/Tae2 family protein